MFETTLKIAVVVVVATCIAVAVPLLLSQRKQGNTRGGLPLRNKGMRNV